MTVAAARAAYEDCPPADLSPLPRSFGALDLEFVAREGATFAHRTFQQGVMRVRFPNVAKGAPPEAVLINIAGGLTGGDGITIGARLGPGAHATITTQAHEKVYRASLGTVAVSVEIGMESGAHLEWLPQPTILFDRASLTRRTDVAMAATARLLAVEAVIFGRLAMLEIMRSGLLDDYWTIRRDGRLIHADRFALDGNIATHLAQPSVLDGCSAMAAVRLVAPDAESKLEMTRALLREDGAASAWNGMLLARIAARDGHHLGAVLARLLTGLRSRPMPPVWTM